MNGSGGGITLKNCPFLGTSVKKDERKCRGIKHCQFADAELINQSHQCVDFDSEDFKRIMAQQVNNTIQSKTFS
jgi:hypothetical protein